MSDTPIAGTPLGADEIPDDAPATDAPSGAVRPAVGVSGLSDVFGPVRAQAAAVRMMVEATRMSLVALELCLVHAEHNAGAHLGAAIEATSDEAVRETLRHVQGMQQADAHAGSEQVPPTMDDG